MMIHLYKARIKCLFRNKEDMFWGYMFPILLATCFFFAFGNIMKSESFDTIPIAYDSQGAEQDPLKTAMTEARMSNGTPMFSITCTDRQSAEKLLDDGKIKAYIIGSADPVMYVKENGISETILKSFLDSYRQISFSAGKIIENNPDALGQGLLQDLLNYDDFVKEDTKGNKPDILLIYYYALLAYTCIYAANKGLGEVINIQADQSLQGARVNVSSINKMKLFLCNLAAAFTVHCGSVLLLFLYMYFGMKINFGGHLIYTFIACISGSLAGITIGATVGVWVKKKAATKEAILNLIVLGGGFLSGMMIVNMKYIIADKVPLLAYINPVNLVSDSLYSLYYYDTHDKFYLNVAILTAMTILFGVMSYIGIRRKNYANI